MTMTTLLPIPSKPTTMTKPFCGLIKKKLTVSSNWNSSRDFQQKIPFFIADILTATFARLVAMRSCG
jgi:hypothetical protein